MGAEEKAPGPAGWLRRVAIGRNPRRTLLRVSLLVALSLLIFNFALLPIRVEGISMFPTYRDKGVHFVNRLAYRLAEPKRGDVVAIRYTWIHLMLMKRVVGLPGETLAFHRGRLYINGQMLDEPYVKTSCDWEIAPQQIGPDEYFVVGDNRSMPEADHMKGRAVRARIMGKIIL